jgi:hypothetical protein
MRRMRIEIAVAVLMLAPLLGYAVGYFFAGGPAGSGRPAAAALAPAAPAVRDGGLDT